MSKSNLILWTLRHRNLKEIAARFADVAAGWLIRPISFITPRSKDKWLIGNKTGWCDNSKYLHIYIAEKVGNVRPIWISKSRKERDYVRKKGLEAYRKWSIKGIYHALTGGAFLFSSNISDINYWASGNAVKINMWHGVGLKKLGMKGSEIYNPDSLTTRILTPFFYDAPTLFIGPSDMMAKHFADCYMMRNEQMLKVGYPRCEFLRKSKREILNTIHKYEDNEVKKTIGVIEKYNKTYIYMPTFRDAQTDFLQASHLDFRAIDELLKAKNQLLILKLHPATRISSESMQDLSNVMELDKNIDIYPILPFTDVLITDYSSIYYDYLLMPDKNIILFPFDYEDYIKNSRDLAFDYLTFSPGQKAWNSNQLMSILDKEPDLSFPEREWIIEQFWGSQYENACEKIIEAISNELGNGFSK